MQTYKLLEQDSVLLSQPSLIEHFGRAGAQFLSQLHYWLEKEGSLGCKHQDIRWIYNSAESWAQQLHLSVRQIRRLISKFIERGVLRVKKLNPCKSNRTNYYSINYEVLNNIIDSKSSKTRCFVHEDILSSSSCHDGTIYNDTKTTNKDFNKSETGPENLIGQGVVSETEQVKQVDLVKNDISKIEKGKRERDNPSQPTTPGKKPTQTSIAQDMLRVWNNILGEKSQATMSKDLAPLLVSAFSVKFEKKMEQWKRYCDLIKTSDYLMKKGFDLSLFWALKFSIIDRLRAGGLGIKPASLSLISEITISEHQTDEMINNLNEPEKIKALRRVIAQAVGSANYHSWFHQATFIEQAGKILLIAPNAFVESKWEELFPWINRENMV